MMELSAKERLELLIFSYVHTIRLLTTLFGESMTFQRFNDGPQRFSFFPNLNRSRIKKVS